MDVPRHLGIIRGQMILSAFGSIVLFKFWHFNLSGMTTSGIELNSLRSNAFEIVHTFDLFFSASCLGDCTFAACRRDVTVQMIFSLILLAHNGH